MKRLLLLLVIVTTGCAGGPDPCLWTVTNNIGSLLANTTLTSLHLRAPGEDWGESVLGEVARVPYGESYSFLLAPGTPLLDLRGVDSEGTTWSRFAENTCEDGTRHETVLTTDDLDVPCTWTITNQIGDAAINYALLDLWVRVTGTLEWGPTLLDDPVPFGSSVEIEVDVGWTYDLSAMDQDGIYSLRLSDQTCMSGQELESTLSLASEAPPCIWEATNRIDGNLGSLYIVAMEVTRTDTGEAYLTEFAPAIAFGEVGSVPFFARAIWTLRAIDELGQTYTYAEAALCLDGGELYGLEVLASDVD